MSTLIQQLLHKPEFKKVVLIIVTFIPAFLGLSIINVIFTHAVVLASYFGGATTTTTANSGSSLTTSGGGDTKAAAAIPKRMKEQGKKQKRRVKTVYVPPTQDDLEQLFLELESSEPLPNNANINTNHGESSMKRAQSAIASLESLVGQKATGVDTALKDVEELIEAYESFAARFEEDIAQYHSNEETKDRVLEHLSQFMTRKSLLDLDRDAMEDLFQGVSADLDALVEDDVLLRNSNHALLKLFQNDASSSSSSCDPSFLDLAKGNPTSELEEATVDAPQQTAATTATKVNNNDAIITEDTARESDLYERIDTIKELLSRRDLSSGDDKDPIDEEGVAEIRAKVSEAVVKLLHNQQDGFATTEEITQHLLKEASLTSNESYPEDDVDNAMCASPAMVEKLVQRGLDSIRSQADLQSALISTVFSVVADESEDDEFQQIMGALDEVMSDIHVPRIDFSGKSYGEEESKNMPPKSDKRKSLSYVVDGPLLHQGVAGSIDSFVELISGYNDYVDEFFDYIMSRTGVSVGTAAADGISDLAAKAPLPELEKLRQSGILGGRIRTLVEE